MKYQIQEILKEFSHLERELILIKYGFYDNKKKTLIDTANVLYEKGYSKRLLGRKTIRIKEKKILEKIKS